jgi:hypothetical protein
VLLFAVLAAGCSFDTSGVLPIDGGIAPVDAPGPVDAPSPADAPPPPLDAPSPPDAPPPDADWGCDPSYTYNEVTGSWYAVHASPMTWGEAEATCEAEGAHLAVIFGQQEDSVLDGLAPDTSLWIGLNDGVAEGDFRWVTGERDDAWHAWNGGEPNDAWGEDCAVLLGFGSDRWNDAECGDTAAFVCECDGRPVDHDAF